MIALKPTSPSVREDGGPSDHPDDIALLLEVLDLVAHDLGSTAGGLRMRAEALRLGASTDMCESAMRAASNRLARIQDAMRLLVGIQRTADNQGNISMPAQNWLEAMAELIPGMLGVGYRLELAEAEGVLQTHSLSGLSASILAYARGFRGRPRSSAAVSEVHLGARQVGTETVMWLDIPALSEHHSDSISEEPQANAAKDHWITLAERIAVRHDTAISGSRSHILWRSLG